MSPVLPVGKCTWSYCVKSIIDVCKQKLIPDIILERKCIRSFGGLGLAVTPKVCERDWNLWFALMALLSSNIRYSLDI